MPADFSTKIITYVAHCSCDKLCTLYRTLFVTIYIYFSNVEKLFCLNLGYFMSKHHIHDRMMQNFQRLHDNITFTMTHYT